MNSCRHGRGLGPLGQQTQGVQLTQQMFAGQRLGCLRVTGFQGGKDGHVFGAGLGDSPGHRQALVAKQAQHLA